MTLLHVDSSILGANSVSRALSASVVAHLTKANPALQVIYRDLAAAPIAHLSGTYLAAGQAGEKQQDPALQTDPAMGSAALEEFLAADHAGGAMLHSASGVCDSLPCVAR